MVRQRRENEPVQEEIRRRIHSVQEKTSLEELPAFTMVEQFACLFCIRIFRGDIELSPFELPQFASEERRILLEVLQELKDTFGPEHFLWNVKLIESRSLLFEIWDLTGQAMRAYGLEPYKRTEWDSNQVIRRILSEQAVQLSPVMEYMLERVSLKNDSIFLTPLPIVRMMSRMTEYRQGETLWDPACGTGSFLVESLRAAQESLGDSTQEKSIGTDIDERMIQIAKINLFFHGFSEKDVTLEADNAFDSSRYRACDVIITNPPVNARAQQQAMQEEFEIPTKKINLQFLQLILRTLNENGRAAVLVNENVLFSNQQAGMAVRRRLLDEGGLCAVISLPQGAFAPYTNAKSSLLILRREPSEVIFFYRLESLGYSLNKKRESISENDIPDLLEKWEKRSLLEGQWKEAYRVSKRLNEFHVEVPQEWTDERCWFAWNDTVRENEYNLSADMYRLTDEEEEAQTSPQELIDELIELERQAMDGLKELMEMMRDGQ